MSLLVESIRIENGRILNISYHNERMARTLYNIYGLSAKPDLENVIVVPESAGSGIYKCRVLYDDKTTEVEFLPYTFNRVRTLRVIFSDEICYPYKYINRDRINSLVNMKGEADDILIVKYGKVTDSSSANLILKNAEGSWITPLTYLLPGTRRANLLKNGLIREADVPYADISQYSVLKLINAMQGFDDAEEIPVSNLIAGS
jgi:4-amino-4-deoxychorismate lyase